MISWVGEKWLDSYGKASILSFRIILRSRSSQIGGQVTGSKLVRLGCRIRDGGHGNLEMDLQAGASFPRGCASQNLDKMAGLDQ
jgi:hypothetical protein